MSLTESERTVLLSVADGVTDKYEIAKRLKKSYSVVYYAIQKLCKLGLIETLGSRQGEKNPRLEVRTYSLTFLGLAVALARSKMWDNKGEKIDQMVERWSRLHPFLGKWKYLNQRLPRGEVLMSLSTTVGEIDGIWSANPKHKLLDNGGRTLFSRTLLTLMLAVTPTSGKFFEVEKWIEAVRGDKELREYVAKQLRKDIDKERRELVYRENLLKKME